MKKQPLFPHLVFFERYNIEKTDSRIQPEIQKQILEFDKIYERRNTVNNDEFTAISNEKLKPLSTTIYNNLVEVFDKEAEEKEKNKEEAEAQRKAAQEAKEKAKSEAEKNKTTPPPGNTEKIAIIKKLFDAGKTSITESELEKEGISGWMDLGYTSAELGPYKLKKGLFSDTWSITMAEPKTESKTKADEANA